MCAVSNVMDGFNERWWPKRDTFQGFLNPPEVTRAEFDKLKAELLALKDALKKAKLYDEQTGQPDCESEDKMAKLRELCKIVGLDFDAILQSAKPSNPDSPAPTQEINHG